MICPGGLRWPAALGPSQRKGTLRDEASATASHSSIEAVAAGQEREVARPREWITGTGLYESGSLASVAVKAVRSSSEDGDVVIGSM